MTCAARPPRRQLSRQVRNLPAALLLRQVLHHVAKANPPADPMQAAGPALARIVLTQAGIASDVAVIRLRVEGKPRRDALIRELSSALGLGGTTWASATAISLILAGIRPPPKGAVAIVAALAGTQLSARQVLRVLQSGVAAEAVDKSHALCQFWPLRNDAVTPTDFEHSNE